jgi:hypothetical protein
MKTLATWFEDYNELAPHKGLRMLSPMEFILQKKLNNHRIHAGLPKRRGSGELNSLTLDINKYMEALYHYCSVQAFLGILQSKMVWLSDASKMNDSHESVWADKVVDRVLDERRLLMSEVDRRNFISGYRLNRPWPFLFCLSSEPDILSQWRAYANDGTGVAIGFANSIFPRQKHYPGTNFASAYNTALWPVVYELEAQQITVNSLFDRASISPGICVAEGGKPEYQLLGSLMAGLCPLLKNPAFQEEKEYRLVHTPRLMTDENNKHSLIGTDYTIKQRIAREQMITYFEYPLPKALVGVISDVWIGPRSRLTKNDVELSLAINGYGNASVKFSSATYRE